MDNKYIIILLLVGTYYDDASPSFCMCLFLHLMLALMFPAYLLCPGDMS